LKGAFAGITATISGLAVHDVTAKSMNPFQTRRGGPAEIRGSTKEVHHG